MPPQHVVLEFVEGCPPEFDESAEYEAGDRVSRNGIVYTCTDDTHLSRFCALTGFEPGRDNSFWRLAWDDSGHCSGTIEPTSSPNVESTSFVGPCPIEYSSDIEHEPGDKVSLAVSTDPQIKIMYECKPWPESMFCEQFAPNHVLGGSLGEQNGNCESICSFGAVRPQLKQNASHFPPVNSLLSTGWDLKGPCVGTPTPTFAPVPFDPLGSCLYNKCVTTTVPCVCGSEGCPTLGQQTTGCTVDSTSCEVASVDVFNSATTYAVGHTVRVGATKFRCKGYPFTGWYSQDAYAPTLDPNGIWVDAWDNIGFCSRTVITDLTAKSTLTMSLDGSCPLTEAEIKQAKDSIISATTKIINASLTEDQSLESVTVNSYSCIPAIRRRLNSRLRGLQTPGSLIKADVFWVLKQVCIGEGCSDNPAVAQELYRQVNNKMDSSVQDGSYTKVLHDAGIDATAKDSSRSVATECTVTSGGGNDGAVSQTVPCLSSMVSHDCANASLTLCLSECGFFKLTDTLLYFGFRSHPVSFFLNQLKANSSRSLRERVSPSHSLLLLLCQLESPALLTPPL